MKKDFFLFFNRCFFAALLVAAIIVPSCTSNPHKVNLNDVTIELEVNRLDQDLFRSGKADFNLINQQLSNKYGDFYEAYLADIINVGFPTDPMIGVQLEFFVNDPSWQDTQRQIDEVFESHEEIKEELELAFRYHKYHFPEVEIPKIVLYNSGFNVGVYPMDKYLGIGLEWFLGPDNPVIQRLAPESFPQYLKDKLHRKYLAVNSVKGWLMVKHQNQLKKEDIINMMIFHGKMMYLLDVLFPEVDDEIKMNYSADNLAWCTNNEYNVWTYLVEQNVLYSSSAKEIAGFLNDGPFTAGLAQDSPARIGIWMGWQAVRQYMKKKPDVSLEELLQEQNHQKILKYYKPR